MKNGQIFKLSRFLLLVRNDLFINRYLFLVYAAAATGVVMFIYGRAAVSGLSPFSDRRLWIFGLYLIGLLFTCRLFSDLHDEPKNIARQMLPATLMEKYSSRIILSTIVFTAGWFIFFYVVSYVSNVGTHLLMGESHRVLKLFDQTLFLESYRYCVIQSILLFGVIYFKKNAPVKTVLSLVTYLLLLFLIYNLIINLVFGAYSKGLAWDLSITKRTLSIGTNMEKELMGFLSSSDAMPMMRFTEKVSEVIFWYLVMPFFWILGFIRLKEMEV